MPVIRKLKRKLEYNKKIRNKVVNKRKTKYLTEQNIKRLYFLSIFMKINWLLSEKRRKRIQEIIK